MILVMSLDKAKLKEVDLIADRMLRDWKQHMDYCDLNKDLNSMARCLPAALKSISTAALDIKDVINK